MTQPHTMMLICTALVCLFVLAIVHALHEQTSALTRIAVASEAMAKQTKPPVAIEVSGFSPEAQQVFNQALKPAKKEKK